MCVCVCVLTKENWECRDKERGLHKGKQMYYLLLITRSMHRSLRLSRSFIKASIGHLHHRHIGTGGGQAVRFAVHYHLPTLQKDKQDQYRCDDYEIHNQPFLCILFCGVAGRQMGDAVGMETGIAGEVVVLLNYKKMAWNLRASLSYHHCPERQWDPRFGNCLFIG